MIWRESVRNLRISIALPFLTALLAGSAAGAETDFDRLRLRMVADQIESRGVRDSLVLEAMRAVPRHRFVPERYRHLAYADRPLPIGEGQTISQPYIVAWMTDLLEVKPGGRVLEVGTGSGYQAAVLAEMGIEVYTIEIIGDLLQSARELLNGLSYGRIHFRLGDGYAGWKEAAPFDGIIVTCAPDDIPEPLKRQLKDGGRMVIPVGPAGGFQTLWQVVRKGDEFETNNMGGVAFVPLTRQIR